MDEEEFYCPILKASNDPARWTLQFFLSQNNVHTIPWDNSNPVRQPTVHRLPKKINLLRLIYQPYRSPSHTEIHT